MSVNIKTVHHTLEAIRYYLLEYSFYIQHIPGSDIQQT